MTLLYTNNKYTDEDKRKIIQFTSKKYNAE